MSRFMQLHGDLTGDLGREAGIVTYFMVWNDDQFASSCKQVDSAASGLFASRLPP